MRIHGTKTNVVVARDSAKIFYSIAGPGCCAMNRQPGDLTRIVDWTAKARKALEDLRLGGLQETVERDFNDPSRWIWIRGARKHDFCCSSSGRDWRASGQCIPPYHHILVTTVGDHKTSDSHKRAARKKRVRTG